MRAIPVRAGVRCVVGVAALLAACGRDRAPHGADPVTAIAPAAPAPTSAASPAPSSPALAAPSVPARPAPLVAARPYGVHIPKTHDARAPLVLLLHGYGDSGEATVRDFGMLALSEAHGAFLAYPEGTLDTTHTKAWNATDACCAFDSTRQDDVAYLDALLDDVLAKYPVDPARIYVLGYSNGGFMAHRYACERSERVAAIVSLAGVPWKDESRCAPREPVSVLQIHGDADTVIKYGGGASGDLAKVNGFDRPEVRRAGGYPGAREAVALWARLDKCSGAPERKDGAREEDLRYAPCAGGAEVQLHTMHGASHQLALDASDVDRIWTFLSAHSRAAR